MTRQIKTENANQTYDKSFSKLKLNNLVQA